MVGIYQDSFIEFLKNTLGEPIKVTSKQIICRCPWCEYGKDKDHYHLWISTQSPIFHCFHGNCEKSGVINKLIKKINGSDVSDKFVDRDTIENFKQKQFSLTSQKISPKINVQLPIIKQGEFSNKEFYLKKRLKFAPIKQSEIKGLVFDVNKFIEINQIPVDENLFRMRDFLHSNFIGFLTENKQQVIFRNIDENSSFRYYKLNIQYSLFNDYYVLRGGNPNSNIFVLAEGIFDIFSEQIFDNLNMKNQIRLYATALSSKYSSLIYSLIFHEQVFNPEIIILSDQGIRLKIFENLKRYNKHLIKKLTVCVNKLGKDFNDTPVVVASRVIGG